MADGWSSPEAPDGTEVLLEPNQNETASNDQQGLVAQGIPATMFAVDDVVAEHACRPVEKGVHFTMEPTEIGPVTIAIFDDTCGKLIQIAQM